MTTNDVAVVILSHLKNFIRLGFITLLSNLAGAGLQKIPIFAN